MQTLVLFVGAGIVILCIMYLSEGKKIQRQIALCEALIRRWGGHVTQGVLPVMYPTLVLHYDEYFVTMSMQPSTPKTHGTTHAFADLACSRTLNEVIAQDPGDAGGLLSKNRQFITENPEFDNALTIQSVDTTFLRNVLSPSLQQQLVALSSQYSGLYLHITHDRLTMRVNRFFQDERNYVSFLECVFACLASIKRCTHIRIVRFDESLVGKTEDSTILWNPDTASIDQPLLGLERIEIHAAFYNFHRVERFLTYILDILGPQHLKRLVDVVIFGNSTLLHPNIRNGVTNLCRYVTESNEADSMSLFSLIFTIAGILG